MGLLDLPAPLLGLIDHGLASVGLPSLVRVIFYALVSALDLHGHLPLEFAPGTTGRAVRPDPHPCGASWRPTTAPSTA